MTTHTIRIRLDGSTVFEEDFPGGTIETAKKLARARYPMAQKVWWVGGSDSKEVIAERRAYEAKRQQYVQEYTDRVYGNNEQPIGQTITTGVTNVTTSGANAVADAGGLGVMVGGVFAIGAAVMTFPIIVGGLTAALVGKVANATFKPSTALALALGAATFTGGTYGGFVLQREYMPEVAQAQVEIVQNVGNAIQGK